jgi:hypothetical protein
MKFEGLRKSKSFGGSLETVSWLWKLLLNINLAKSTTSKAIEDNYGQKECAKWPMILTEISNLEKNWGCIWEIMLISRGIHVIVREISKGVSKVN